MVSDVVAQSAVAPTGLPASTTIEKETPDSASSQTQVEFDGEKQDTDSLEKGENENEYPPTREVVIIMLALYLTMFLMALVSVPWSKAHCLNEF